MTEAVLDASAILALLKGERGGSKVAGVVSEAAVGVFNQAEVVMICPPLSGPETMIVWTAKGTLNAEQEAQAGRDHRQAA